MNLLEWVIAIAVFALLYFFILPELSTEVPAIVTKILKILTLVVAAYWLVIQLELDVKS